MADRLTLLERAQQRLLRHLGYATLPAREMRAHLEKARHERQTTRDGGNRSILIKTAVSALLEAEQEIERLREYEFRYKDLCK